MAKPRIAVGLDVGTTKVCAIIAETVPPPTPRQPVEVEVLGVGLAPSFGVRRGVIVDIRSTVEAIDQARRAAERMAGMNVLSAVVGITGDHIVSQNEGGCGCRCQPGAYHSGRRCPGSGQLPLAEHSRRAGDHLLSGEDLCH